jgi:g-D-glutamyl-meso-diaminopimelate peptidase
MSLLGGVRSVKVQLRKGDSLWYYSQLFRLPLNLIVDSNRSINNYDQLAVGQDVALPGFRSRDYHVQSGETVWSIAHKHKLSLDALMLLNQQKDLSTLNTGDTITIPQRVVQRVIDTKKKYDYQSLADDINHLAEVYPFLECTTIGQSVMKKPLLHLRVGSGREKVHWNGSFHANEWITTALIMNLVNDYLLSLTNYTTLRGVPGLPLYSQAMLSVVPMVNPDGVDLVLHGPPESDAHRKAVEFINGDRPDYQGWKANIRGVDLNKHFPANWEVEKVRKEEKVPSPRDYPGDTPLTEPEAIAMAELAERESFNKVIAVHTQGEEFYWGYEGMEPPVSESIAKEFERVSTYKSVRYVDSHAGYKDWFIQKYKRPGFTLELGKGINPIPLSQYETIYRKTLGIFVASLYM